MYFTLVLAITSLPSIFTSDFAACLLAISKALRFVITAIGRCNNNPGIAIRNGKSSTTCLTRDQVPQIATFQFLGEFSN